MVAALNSIEMVTVPWWFLTISGQVDNGLVGRLNQRLAHIRRKFNADLDRVRLLLVKDTVATIEPLRIVGHCRAVRGNSRTS